MGVGAVGKELPIDLTYSKGTDSALLGERELQLRLNTKLGYVRTTA